MANEFAATVKAGSTSVSIPVLLTKTADGTEQTGTVASGVTASYARQGAGRTAITVSDLSLITSAWSAGGWKEYDATNQKGLFRFDVPDAAFAAGAQWVVVTIQVASCFVYHERFNLDAGAVTAGRTLAVDASGQITVGGYAAGQAPLQPTTAGRTLDVAATGEAGLDFDNIHDATGAHTLTNITVPAVTALAAGERDAIAAALLDLANGVESGETLRSSLRLFRSVLAGIASVVDNGNGTKTVTYRRKDGTTGALVITHDAIGNRSVSTPGTL